MENTAIYKKMKELLDLAIKDYNHSNKCSKTNIVKIADHLSEEAHIITEHLFSRGKHLEEFATSDKVKYNRSLELEFLLDFHDAARDAISEALDTFKKRVAPLSLNANSNKTIYLKLVEQNIHNTHSRIQQGRMLLYTEYDNKQQFASQAAEAKALASDAVDVSWLGVGWGVVGCALAFISLFIKFIV